MTKARSVWVGTARRIIRVMGDTPDSEEYLATAINVACDEGLGGLTAWLNSQDNKTWPKKLS